jgi:hypothetical protein
MAASQFEDATRRDSVKNFASCYRTLQFGTRLLTTGKVRFDPVPEEIQAELAGKSPCDPIYHKFEELNEDYNLSELPDAVDEELFREFLYHLRSDQLLYGE